MDTMNGFEKREWSRDACSVKSPLVIRMVDGAYWDDPRWKEVRKLREEGQDIKANGLVDVIKDDWHIV